MNKYLILILCVIVLAAEDTQDHEEMVQNNEGQVVANIGQVISGSIDPQVSEQNLHNIRISEFEGNYLFLRISLENSAKVSLGLYSNTTRQLVHACLENTFDSCYIPTQKLNKNEVYVILVACQIANRYILYSYWGSVQHLEPNSEIKFTFEEKDPTQIFHLELNETTDYEQIRLVLQPSTTREPNDNLKIFVNKGFTREPTEKDHDFASFHIWHDAEGVFLTKQQLSGEKGIAIYIAGSSQTVYTFTTELIDKEHHDIEINETIHEYLDSKQEKSAIYHVNFSADNTSDSYAIKASLYNGEISVAFFYDQEMKKPYNESPMQYMSDIEFLFQKEDFSGEDFSIYMKIQCPDSSAIYSLTLQGRNHGKAFQIEENVYEFLPVRNKQAVYFYHHVMVQEAQTEQTTFTFELSSISVQGQIALDFYICQPSVPEEKCKNYDDKEFITSTMRVSPQRQEVGSKTLHKIVVGTEFLRRLNSLEKNIMVVCVARNQKSNSQSSAKGLVALQYSNPNKIRQLREDRAFEDRVGMQQTKYYKYINNDPNIHNIKVYINEISGLIKTKVQRTDFRGQFSGKTIVNPMLNEQSNYMITDKVDEPIYIAVTGMVSSFYTVTVSAYHLNHPITSSMNIAEDIQYEIKLAPNEMINIEIHPIETEVDLEYRVDGGLVMICEINSKGLCVDNNENELQGNSLSKGSIKLNSTHQRIFKYRFGNFNTDKNISESKLLRTIKVYVVYHSSRKNHCDLRKINQVYNELAQTGKCYKFQLPLITDVEIFQARQDIGASFSMYLVCDTKIDPNFSNERLVIPGNVISDKCKNSPEDIYILMLVADISPEVHNDVRLEFSVEYKNDTITLADGVGYHSAGRAIQGPIRTFFYEVLDNRVYTQITLLNKKGTQKFFVDITFKGNKYSAVSESRALISSRSSAYYSNPSITVTPTHLSDARCSNNCVIVISIFSTESAGSEIEYTIQVTQNEIKLKEDSIRSDFLAKGSFAYYKYETRKDKSDLLIKASDNGRNCEKIYLARKPFPSPSNYIAQENSGTLIHGKTDKGVYYIGIEAIQNCEYHLYVSEDNAAMTKLEYGSYYDLKMKAGEGKWFYNNHVSDNSFKIISLLKYGSLKIYVNSTELNRQTFASITDKTLDVEQFSFKTDYKNTLIVESGKPGFCKNCHYLLYIEAKELTETTIYMGGQDSKISLEVDKVFYDEMKSNDAISMATFYKVSAGTLFFKVHGGKVKIQMTYRNQSFVKEYEENKKVYQDPYNFTRSQESYDPILIKVTPLKVPAYYSYELNPDANSQENKHKLTPGEHTYIYVSNQDEQCLNGFLKNKNQQIYLTGDSDEVISLGSMKIQAKLNAKETNNYESQLIGNILSLKFIFDSVFFTESIPFSFCFKANKDEELSLLAFQTSEVNIIQSDTEVLVRSDSTFVMYPSGDVILDVFECKGKSEIHYASEKEKLKNSKPEELESIGISGQSHAIKLESYSTLFLNVKAQLATVNWTPLDPSVQKGVGYFKYQIGKLSYESKFNKIDFNVGQIFTQKETKTTVKSIKYTIFISNSQQKLQEAVMCEMIQDQKLYKFTVEKDKAGALPSSHLIISMKKKDITKIFSKNQTLYFNAVADLTLFPPQSQQEEHYRFVYFEQQVPAEVFRQNKVEKIEVSLLIILALVTIAGILIISYVFIKWIVPAIGKLKNRILVEQKDDGKDQSIAVPPSSDRNQIQSNNLEQDLPPTTQDQMN